MPIRKTMPEVVLVQLVSNSTATGLVLDIFKEQFTVIIRRPIWKLAKKLNS